MNIPSQRQTHKHNFKIINATKDLGSENEWSCNSQLCVTAEKCLRQLADKERLAKSKERSQMEEMGDYNLNQEQRGWAGATLGSCTAVLFQKVLMTSTRSTYQRHAPITWGSQLGPHPKVLPLPHGPCLPFQWTLRRHSIHNQTITNSIINMFCLYFFLRCAQQ